MSSSSIQSHTGLRLLVFGFISHTASCRVLGGVPCTGQKVLVDYLLTYQCSYINPVYYFFPLSHLSSLVNIQVSVFSIRVYLSIFWFQLNMIYMLSVFNRRPTVWSSPGPPELLQAALLFSCLWLSDVPLCTCTASSLCIHLLMDNLLASWWLKVLLQWHLGTCVFYLWVFFKYVPKSWIADPVGTVISFLRNFHNVFCSDSYQVPFPPTA